MTYRPQRSRSALHGALHRARHRRLQAGKHPGFVEPALATLRTKPPTGAGYIHEIKFDGYRVQAHLRGGLAYLYARSGLNWTKRFPTSLSLWRASPRPILDGEVISANERGAASFSALQDDLSRAGTTGWPTTPSTSSTSTASTSAQPARERKRVLGGLLKEAGDIGPLFLSDHFDDEGAMIFDKSCELGLEGIVSKVRNAPYRSGEPRRGQ